MKISYAPVFTRIAPLAVLCALAVSSLHVRAAEIGGFEVSGSGFATLGVGAMLGGSDVSVNDYNCPCFASDYAQAGVYDGRSGLQWKPDSKLGLQGSISFDERRYSLTAQAVARGARDGKINLEWVYASARLTDALTLQVGRKRLPMFYYSDTQDIGYTLPWTHLPPQLYGWEAVNYNGGSLRWQGDIGEWSTSAEFLAGQEKKEDSGYWKIYNGRRSRTDIRWDDIFGANVTVNRDWLEARLVYIQSKNAQRYVTGVWDPELGDYDDSGSSEYGEAFPQRIYGLAINIDYENWLVRSEMIYIRHPGLNYADSAQILGAGYRWGKWTPMLTFSNYHSVPVAVDGEPAPGTAMEKHYTVSATLRYDLGSNSALKVQYDDQRSRSGPDYPYQYGDARLLTVAWDVVF